MDWFCTTPKTYYSISASIFTWCKTSSLGFPSRFCHMNPYLCWFIFWNIPLIRLYYNCPSMSSIFHAPWSHGFSHLKPPNRSSHSLDRSSFHSRRAVHQSPESLPVAMLPPGTSTARPTRWHARQALGLQVRGPLKFKNPRIQKNKKSVVVSLGAKCLAEWIWSEIPWYWYLA